MSLGCMVNVLGTWFGLEITQGGITQLVDRLRDRTQPSYQQVMEHVRGSGVVGLDAVMRKVTGGTRSAHGSRSLAHWMTISQTLHKNGLSLRDYVNDSYRAHLQGRAPPSVFAD